MTGPPAVGHPVVVKHSCVGLAVVVLALSVAGCRQPDGPLPSMEGSVPNELGDLGRDLLSAASGQADGSKDLADDLAHFQTAASEGQRAERRPVIATGTASPIETIANA